MGYVMKRSTVYGIRQDGLWYSEHGNPMWSDLDSAKTYKTKAAAQRQANDLGSCEVVRLTLVEETET